MRHKLHIKTELEKRINVVNEYNLMSHLTQFGTISHAT